MSAPRLDDAFRRLQAGDAAGALRIAGEVAAMQPANARAHLAAGIALRSLGRAEAAREAFERASRLAPGDYAPPFELGVLLESTGRLEEAAAQYERSAALRPEFLAAHFAAGLLHARSRDWDRAAARFDAVLGLQPDHVEALAHRGQVLAEQGRHDEALALLGRAVALDPRRLESLVAPGRAAVARGDYATAARYFLRAAALQPTHADLPLYAAQVLLLLGRWREAWDPHYARRDSRIEHERRAAAAGRPYRVPRLEELGGRDVVVIGEQGLGDILFFLRFAPRLRPSARRLAFAGDRRLHGIVSRTGVFDAISEAPEADAVPLLAGDLPLAVEAGDDVFAPSLRAAPLPERVAALRAELAAAPRPWIAVTWRSGTPRELSREALSKSVPIPELFRALSPLPGTVLAFQRGLGAGEIESASAALGRPVRDLSRWSDDPEDALALVSLVDRHIGVSSTNMHLAALAGATADVLVPFPPEWRWRASGASPWFPGFRVHREAPVGGWDGALGELARPA
ncbi:MAG TPA: tetratricopeptide repeat protein [Usitatibacter sp.]|nr:tetratricopeptide repeat protein [Usitatibacter sp.]